MSKDNTTLILGALIFGGFILYSQQAKATPPPINLPPAPVNFPPDQLPPASTGWDKAQMIFTIFTQLVAAGMDIGQAVTESKRQADYNSYKLTATATKPAMTYDEWKAAGKPAAVGSFSGDYGIGVPCACNLIMI